MRAALLALLALAGCSGGAGVSVTGLAIGNSDGSTPAQLDSYECFTSRLIGYARFEGDGQSSLVDYSSRFEWSSSDPEVLLVGDGVTPGPAGGVIAPGYFVGRRPGTAVVTVRYIGLVATLPVEVVAIPALRIEPGLTDIAEHLQAPFTLEARLADGQPWTDITALALWRAARADAPVDVDETSGVVTALSAQSGDVPVELLAELPGCSRSGVATFRVSAVQGLEIDYEAGGETSLPIGYGESLGVYARFAAAGSTRQNVSAQVEVGEYNDDVLTVTGDDESLYVASTEDPGSAGFTVSLADGPSLTTKTWTTAELELQALGLTPATQTIDYPDSGAIQAIGQFEDGSLRPITRSVSWSSGSSALRVAASGEITGSDVDESVTLTATVTRLDDQELDDQASVRLRSYASASAGD